MAGLQALCPGWCPSRCVQGAWQDWTRDHGGHSDEQDGTVKVIELGLIALVNGGVKELFTR